MKRVFLLSCLCSVLLCSALSANAEKVCDARKFGAVGDGKTKDTAALQKAIDDCAATKGGGTVRLAGGTFLSGPIVLKSNITLEVAKGSTLLGSADFDDYPKRTEFNAPGRQPLVSADHAQNIVITGGGTIDGNGFPWWPIRDQAGVTRPRLVVFYYSKHIRMEDITVQNSPMWQIVPYYSDDLVFRNMQVLAPAISHNTDGIDPFSSSHIVIDHVLIDTGDDNIAIKSGQPGSAGPDAPSHDIVITDCTFLRGHGLSIGSEIAGGVQNVRAERITFKGTGTGIRIKSNRDRGNDIGNFLYKDITMEDVKTPILISEFYPKIPAVIAPEPLTRLTPHFHDIVIENVKATGAKEAMVIVGIPESPILNLKMTNVQISAQTGAKIQYAQLDSKGLVVTAVEGQPITLGEGVTGQIK